MKTLRSEKLQPQRVDKDGTEHCEIVIRCASFETRVESVHVNVDDVHGNAAIVLTCIPDASGTRRRFCVSAKDEEKL